MNQGISVKLVSSFAIVSLAMGLFAVGNVSAGLPKTKTDRIVPGKSIAGLSLGKSMNQAKKIWKDPDGSQLCPIVAFQNPSGNGFVDYERCIFELASSGANYNTGNIYFIGKAGKKTVAIGVRAPNDGSEQDFSSKMNRYKTKQGIGIGSNLGKLKRTFKRKLKKDSASGGYSIYRVKGPGKSSTEFSLDGNRVYGIEVRSSKAP